MWKVKQKRRQERNQKEVKINKYFPFCSIWNEKRERERERERKRGDIKKKKKKRRWESFSSLISS